MANLISFMPATFHLRFRDIDIKLTSKILFRFDDLNRVELRRFYLQIVVTDALLLCSW